MAEQRGPAEDFVPETHEALKRLIPRPEGIQACAELDRVSSLGNSPRWRSVRLVLERTDGEVSFRCWWTYDWADGNKGAGEVVEWSRSRRTRS